MWFNKIVKIGQRSALVASDLYDLDSDLQGKLLADKWKELWSKDVKGLSNLPFSVHPDV
jgi:hypothetical protein